MCVSGMVLDITTWLHSSFQPVCRPHRLFVGRRNLREPFSTSFDQELFLPSQTDRGLPTFLRSTSNTSARRSTNTVTPFPTPPSMPFSAQTRTAASDSASSVLWPARFLLQEIESLRLKSLPSRSARGSQDSLSRLSEHLNSARPSGRDACFVFRRSAS